MVWNIIKFHLKFSAFHWNFEYFWTRKKHILIKCHPPLWATNTIFWPKISKFLNGLFLSIFGSNFNIFLHISWDLVKLLGIILHFLSKFWKLSTKESFIHIWCLGITAFWPFELDMSKWLSQLESTCIFSVSTQSTPVDSSYDSVD
jgi:hypothetical protein